MFKKDPKVAGTQKDHESERILHFAQDRVGIRLHSECILHEFFGSNMNKDGEQVSQAQNSKTVP